MDDAFSQIIIDKFFEDNPNLLINHHLESFNEFYNSGIQRIFREKNPIKIMKDQDPNTGNFNLRCNLYLAGKNGDKLYYGKPIIYDDDRAHFMYPNEARLRNMTYGITIHYDVDLEFFIAEICAYPPRKRRPTSGFSSKSLPESAIAVSPDTST